MKLKVFYNDNQTAKTNDSYSPSATKPAEVLKSWQNLGLPLEVISDFSPVTIDQLCKAHEREYVEGVMNLTQNNGFSNRLPEIRDSLLWTSGSFMAAAIHAIETGAPCASLTSGFHHANYNNGGGYCTFNGLMATAIHLKESRLANKIGILDLDAHYGDGTDDIIEKLDIDYIEHYTFGEHRIIPENSDDWIKTLESIVEKFEGCDVLLYQAGADPHIDDPLGGSLTSEQMRERDRIVFEVCKALNIPVVWNLAGGYQTPLRKVLDIHDATAQECLAVYGE